MVQLGLCASTAGGLGLIPGRGTEIPHAAWHGQRRGLLKILPNSVHYFSGVLLFQRAGFFFLTTWFRVEGSCLIREGSFNSSKGRNQVVKG